MSKEFLLPLAENVRDELEFIRDWNILVRESDIPDYSKNTVGKEYVVKIIICWHNQHPYEYILVLVENLLHMWIENTRWEIIGDIFNPKINFQKLIVDKIEANETLRRS